MRSVLALILATTATTAWAADGGGLQREVGEFVDRYCVDCHGADEPEAGLNLDDPQWLAGFGRTEWDTAGAEKVWRRLRTRQMPPIDAERPDEGEYQQTVAALESLLDGHAAANPNPGRTESIRRLTRTEYRNAIRDLLALEVDVEELLPADELAHGFDNVTVSELSPLLLSRYVSAAEKIAARAIGSASKTPGGVTFRLPPDRSQEDHVEGLPLGTRGGGLFTHQFPQTGEYQFRLRLARDRDEHIEGLHGKHEIDLLVDRELAASFSVERPKLAEGQNAYEHTDHTTVDAHLHKRLVITAGVHRIGVTFPRKSASIPEILREPFDASFNRHRHPRRTPALLELSIVGPFDAQGPGDTASRRRVLGDTPAEPANPTQAARGLLARLMRLAYRRPITDDDLATPMRFFNERSAEGFDAGVEAALAAVLVSPHFLFRVEQEPVDAASGQARAVPDLELASRLSFFLWSSLPDDELLSLAEAGRLRESGVLEAQVERMLGDPRCESLVANFASQWLHLRNLEGFHPDMRRFVDFDDNLRQAMLRETELLMASVVRDERSLLELIDSDTVYLNERLATHYGIPGVRGSHFRPVPVGDGHRRGGLLRQGAVLAVTSYANRTSPTIRGYWVLKNLLGTPPPPPPPDVPDLEKAASAEATTVRAQLEIHRSNPACASCHDLMDPIGLALENYDAIGRWREREHEAAIDASGILPDGAPATGVDALEANLLSRPEVFVGTMAEKLLTFALGRGVEPTDMPAIRRATRLSAENDYRFSALVLGLVSSDPFQKRTAR